MQVQWSRRKRPSPRRKTRTPPTKKNMIKDYQRDTKQPTDNEEETEAAKKMERPRMSRVFGLGHHQSVLSIKDNPSIRKKKIT